MNKEYIRKRLSEEFSKTDKKEIQKMIDDSFDDFLEDKSFEKKLEAAIKANLKIKGVTKLEKEVGDISKNVITQLFKILWVRRNFWKNSIKE